VASVLPGLAGPLLQVVQARLEELGFAVRRPPNQHVIIASLPGERPRDKPYRDALIEDDGCITLRYVAAPDRPPVPGAITRLATYLLAWSPEYEFGDSGEHGG